MVTDVMDKEHPLLLANDFPFSGDFVSGSILVMQEYKLLFLLDFPLTDLDLPTTPTAHIHWPPASPCRKCERHQSGKPRTRDAVVDEKPIPAAGHDAEPLVEAA